MWPKLFGLTTYRVEMRLICKYKYTSTQIQIHKYCTTSWSSVGDATDSICSIWLLSTLLHAYKYQTMMQSFVMRWWGWKMIVPINEYVSWLMDGPDPEAVVTYMASVIVVTHCFLWGGFSWDDFLKYKNMCEALSMDQKCLVLIVSDFWHKTKWNWRTQFLGNFLQMTLELSFLLVTGHVD